MKNFVLAIAVLLMGAKSFAAICSEVGYEQEILAGIEETLEKDIIRVLAAKGVTIEADSYVADVQFSEAVDRILSASPGTVAPAYAFSVKMRTTTGQPLSLQSKNNFLSTGAKAAKKESYAFYFSLAYDSLNGDGSPVNGRCEAKPYTWDLNYADLVIMNDNYHTAIAAFNLSPFAIYPIK